MLGRELRGWVVWSLYAVFLSTLGLLVVGPEPWRATRWAWFWLLTSAAFPLTALAFLVLGGPTPLVPAPRERSRRLTGGWAFSPRQSRQHGRQVGPLTDGGKPTQPALFGRRLAHTGDCRRAGCWGHSKAHRRTP